MECYLDHIGHIIYFMHNSYILPYEEIDKMIDTAFDAIKGS